MYFEVFFLWDTRSAGGHDITHPVFLKLYRCRPRSSFSVYFAGSLMRSANECSSCARRQQHQQHQNPYNSVQTPTPPDPAPGPAPSADFAQYVPVSTAPSRQRVPLLGGTAHHARAAGARTNTPAGTRLHALPHHRLARPPPRERLGHPATRHSIGGRRRRRRSDTTACLKLYPKH